jgi:sialate O-acetylesterase
VAYFFGRHIHTTINVPVGLVNTSWGGTRIEPWTPPEGFAMVPALAGYLEQRPGDLRENYLKALRGFLAEVEKKVKEHLEPKRKEEQPEEEAAEEGGVALDVPVPEDPQLPNARLIKKWLPSAKKAVDEDKPVPALEGGWPRGWPVCPGDPRQSPGITSALYNGMVYPLLPFAIRGALWYQGESNRGDGMGYYHKMQALIGGWRKVWAQGDFPFYYVQLAPFTYGGDTQLLAEIWEAQTATLSVPNTGMIVTTDIGNVKDIHPRNKQEVGRRLALWALAKTYGKTEIVYSGPLYKAMAIEGNKARVTFDHVGGGLVSRDGKPLTHFTVAAEGQQFVPATAVIDGESVVVSAEGIEKPAAVRFGWQETAEPNLANREGLPASPFRTDRWERQPAKAEGN